MVAATVPLLVSASESPDRECCDGPSYKLEPGAGRGQEASFPRYNYPPPEVPDFPEYGPHEQMPPRVPGYGPGKLATWSPGVSYLTPQNPPEIPEYIVCI